MRGMGDRPRQVRSRSRVARMSSYLHELVELMMVSVATCAVRLFRRLRNARPPCGNELNIMVASLDVFNRSRATRVDIAPSGMPTVRAQPAPCIHERTREQRYCRASSILVAWIPRHRCDHLRQTSSGGFESYKRYDRAVKTAHLPIRDSECSSEGLSICCTSSQP